ncbi:TonB-dependent siderophore receptor [uncultured Paracoccus sp.]|uniref:TonB-dependent receptor plug domain-containing protein n=1 Tax=uncultured Paracoccus sp. TaxID=189685 RepID=UPI002625D76F|nr:TonB-dependent receptor [uncultured Paracoccus sp.]
MDQSHQAPATRRLLALTVTIVLPVGAGPGAAQEPVVLDPLVISGGFAPIPAAAYGRATTTLHGEDLRERGILTVQDALRGVPGLSVSSSGTSNTLVRIRGAEANHTLILIDGIEASAGDGQYALSGIDTATVDRIEVLRGPQSVFYGADAAAGVVNIITTREGGGRAGVEIGNGVAGWLSTGIDGPRGGLSLSYSGRDDRGYDVSGDGGEEDGIRRHGLSLAGDARLTDGLRAGFLLRLAEERYDYDLTSFNAATADEYLVDGPGEGERDERAAETFLEYDAMDGRVLHRLAYQETRLDLAQDDDPAIEARTRALKYRATIGLDGPAEDADRTLSLALDHRRDENSLSPDNRRRNNSVALEYRAALPSGIDLQLGLRHDDNSVFASTTTYAAAISWQPPGSPYRLHASAGTGSVNPDYFELLGGYGLVGNPDLRPEQNRSFDIGVEAGFAAGRGLIDVTYFNERLEDEIAFSGVVLADGTNFSNDAGTSRREGVEIAARYDLSDDLTVAGAYTYLDASNADGSVELRRPRHELALNARLRVAEGRGVLAADLKHVRGNFDAQYFGNYAVAELPDYTVVGVAGSYDLTDTVRATARITNLLDDDHVDVWGYAGEGRTAWVGLQTRW